MTEISTSNQISFQIEVEKPEWYNALSLGERITNLRNINIPLIPKPEISQAAKRRIMRWVSQPPFERDNYLSERLEHSGINRAEFEYLVAETATEAKARNSKTPEWLQEIARVFDEFNPTECKPYPKIPGLQENTLLLLEAIRPLVQYGFKKLENGVEELVRHYTSLPFDPSRITELFFTSLPPQLTARLSQTLALEVNVYRLRGQLEGDNPEERFRNWINRLGYQGEIIPILQEYPVLARQLMVTINNWVKTGLEFLERLSGDWAEILAAFSPDTDPGQLIEIDGGAGDAHRGGRSVLRLKFSSGLRLIYKPKSLAIDLHFQELLKWLNEKGDHLPFPLLKLINRGAYGWTEFIPAMGCKDSAGIERFYERQGGYLALLYALEATDFHYENLIASGENPVLIDLEALFHPRPEESNVSQSDFLAASLVGYSALRVGLLPRRSWSNDKSEGVDLSGLNGKGGQLTPRPVPLWEAWATDEMRLTRQHVPIPDSQNRPRLIQGDIAQEVDVLDYKEFIMLGFTRIYRLMMEHHAELINGPLAQFANDEIRIVLRATNTYSKLLHESFHPDMLRNALERDRFFDHLWLPVTRMPYLSQVIPAEQADLLCNDIPMFTTRPNTRDIFTSREETISEYFEESSLAIVSRRIAQLNEKDLSLQLWFIEASFATVPLGTSQSAWKPSRLEPSKTRATRELLIAEAKAIGDKLESLAIQVDNDASWVGLSLLSQKQWVLIPAGADMYSGITGIAYFLAYLGAVTGEERYTRLARYAVVSVRRQVAQFKDAKISTGAFEGWGAPIYLYSHLGSLWNDKTLLEEADLLVEQLNAQIRLDNKNVDIIGGSAGAILSLLSQHRATSNRQPLEVAMRCGDHLIESSSPMPHGIGWVSHLSGEKPLTGFSHGAAGIAYSLLKLHAACGEERFRQAAMSALEYERSWFSPEEQNWPDLRPDELIGAIRNTPEGEEAPLSYMTTWCHGAPGIGLGRAGSFKELAGDSQVIEEIEAAINTTLSKGFGMNHSLCHGDLGNLDTLLTAAQALNRADYHQKVEMVSAMVLDSIKKYGWLTGIPMGVTSPGLLTGIAGIGYGLLRLAAPTKVPSILLVEGPR